MKIKLQFLARYRELVGSRELEMEVEWGMRLSELKSTLEDRFPQLRGHPMLLLVNGEYPNPDYLLEPGNRVSLLPPFSGGD